MHNSISYLSLRSSPHLFLSHTPPLLPGLPSIQRYHLPSLDVAPPPFPSHPLPQQRRAVRGRGSSGSGASATRRGAVAAWGCTHGDMGLREWHAAAAGAEAACTVVQGCESSGCTSNSAEAATSRCRAAARDPSPMGAQGCGSSTHAVWDRAQGSHFLFDLWTGRRGVTRP